MSFASPDIGAARTLAGATVLQVVPDMQDDWIGQAALNLASVLLRSGARAMIAGKAGPLVGELQALGGEWQEFDFATASPLRRRRNIEALQELIAEEHVELVHAHGLHAARCAEAAVRRDAVALATTYIGTPPQPSWFTPPQDAMARGKAVIAFSSFAAELIAERHEIPRERIAVIPRSVDTAWFDPSIVRADRVAALRHAWRINPGERVILAPGRLASAQGQIHLIDAARILVTGGLRGCIFVIAGNDRDDDTYQKVIDERIVAQGLTPIFRRVGHCADMPAAYALADVVVLPIERPTTFSVTAVEAQSMGRPVIVSNAGALPELILSAPLDSTASRTGWLVRPRDPLDLARALAAAYALDASAQRALGTRARALAEARFAAPQVAVATLAVYGALLDNAE